MEILYYGFDGARVNIGCACICIVGFIIMIVMGIFAINEKEKSGTILSFIFAVIFGLGAIVSFSDERVPIIKTIFTEEISWQEINSKYTLKEQEGKIYTFKVNNMTTEEWEKIIEENNKEN